MNIGEPSAEVVNIEGKYRTVVIDPPWPIRKSQRKVRPLQTVDGRGLDYPTMTVEAIRESRYPFGQKCHVYLWTTQRFLPIAFGLFETWGVKYAQTLVWHKNVGFTPFGQFMNNAEFVLFGRIGNLPLMRVGRKCVFEGRVREHSRKPDAFYDLVREVSPEPRIDIFSREEREGFYSWGNERGKFKG